MSFDIVFDPASLDRSSHGSITGRISVHSGDVAFPESEWSDFPAVIVRWWIDEARALETGTTGRFRFMDGPFEFTATPLGDGSCELSFVHSSHEIFSAQATVSDVLDAVRRVAKEIVAECRSRNWQSNEIDELWYAVR